MVLPRQRLSFQEIDRRDAADWQARMSASDNPACEFSFVTCYMWRNFYKTRMILTDDCLLMKSEEDGENSYMVLGGDLFCGLERIQAHCEAEDEPFRVFCTGEQTADAIASRYAGHFTRLCNDGDTDYIYRRRDLAELSGSRYHAKRNHIAAFSKQYDWRYESLTADRRSDALAVADAWYHHRAADADAETKRELSNENTAIHEVLTDGDALPFCGGVVYVSDKPIAFTLASPITVDTWDVHIEKALPDYAGAYAVINREFARTAPPECRFLNREDDMNVEGLRRAKLSYHPVLLLKKYTFEIEL